MNEILKERFFKLEQELELADAEISKLKAENARLRADTPTADAVVWRERANELERDNARLAAENFKLKGELGSVRSGTGKLCKFYRAELRELRDKLDEISRLEEECKKLSVEGATICYQCGTINPAQTLRDLLAPTIEALAGMLSGTERTESNKDDFKRAERELQRLRALCGDGKAS